MSYAATQAEPQAKDIRVLWHRRSKREAWRAIAQGEPGTLTKFIGKGGLTGEWIELREGENPNATERRPS